MAFDSATHSVSASRSAPASEKVREMIRTAERYPFVRPERSYLFRSAPDAILEADWRTARTPVLAIGANASPERLRLKFGTAPHAIPVTRASLEGFAVVHAAHFARYGAIPATLHPATACTVDLFVTWLDPAQLALMHRSEGVGQRYRYVLLDGLHLDAEGVGAVTRAGAYVSRAGAYSHRGAPVRVTGIPTRGAAFPVWSQRRILRAAGRRLAPELTYEAFMTQIVRCFGFRVRQTLRLSRDAAVWPADCEAPG